MSSDVSKNGETHEGEPQDALEETSALWETARDMLGWLMALCGGPCALVAQPGLARKERKNILKFLRSLEGIVRRLLVIEAVRLAQMRPRVRHGGRAKPGARKMKKRSVRAPFCRVSFPDPEDSSGWAVRFTVSEPSGRTRKSLAARRFMPRARSLETDADILAPAALSLAAEQHRRHLEENHAQPTRPRLKPSRRAGNPWLLAKRIEAVARVLANPTPWVRRLARRLRKDPRPLFSTCRPPPVRWTLHPPYGEGAVRAASEHALEALAAFRFPRGSDP